MIFWNGWSERVLLDICFLIAIGQSTSHHEIRDSTENSIVRFISKITVCWHFTAAVFKSLA